MKSSIRKFLLINLLFAVTLTTTLTAVGNYYLDQKNIQEHLDTLMAISALSYQALLGDDVYERQLMTIQDDLNTIPGKIEHYYPKAQLSSQSPEFYLEKFNFQVWSDSNHLLLHSSGAPKLPLLSKKEGFHNKIVEQQHWRVFTTTNPKAKIRTVLAERYDTRNELGRRIALDDLYIMLLTLPLSGFLIWVVIGRGLDNLESVAEELANREPNHLEPVKIEALPDEIRPVIDELNKLFYRLKEGFEREARFAADAAHELRTPLAALKAQAQVALNTNDINEKNIALQKVIASVNRNTHIVQQLLTMSKLVPEQATINDLDDVNLAIITREILAMLAPAAIEKQIELEFEPDQNVATFPGTPTAISILIRNLVDNAIRYTEPHGHVIVRVYQRQSDVVLEVEDNGPGIPPQLHSRVFERFFRELGNKGTGSGLGLAIVQQIAILHHADITLDAPSSGTGLIVRVFFHLKTSFMAETIKKRDKS
ncbi:MAG: two-component sensor histidine kinase [Legionella sp.]|nr:MAG: two-component sensor histidine kinase [Legionella sp.]